MAAPIKATFGAIRGIDLGDSIVSKPWLVVSVSVICEVVGVEGFQISDFQWREHKGMVLP